MVEVTNNAIAVNKQIFNELIENRNAAKAAMSIEGQTNKNWFIHSDAYNNANDQVKLMARICLNLGIEL